MQVFFFQKESFAFKKIVTIFSENFSPKMRADLKTNFEWRKFDETFMSQSIEIDIKKGNIFLAFFPKFPLFS